MEEDGMMLDAPAVLLKRPVSRDIPIGYETTADCLLEAPDLRRSELVVVLHR